MAGGSRLAIQETSMNPHSHHPGAPIATPEKASHGHDHRDAGGGHGGHSDAAKKTGGDVNVEYTCPMHPQVRQMGRGNCPICGMALEPVVATEATGESAELRDMNRRFWIGLALSLPVVVLEMGGHLIDLHRLLSQQTSNWLQMLFGTPVVLWAGWPFFVR